VSSLPDNSPGFYGPYERAIIKGLEVIEKVMDSQPPEVQAKLWQRFVEDQEALRVFWSRFNFDITLPK
jgi:hypothetical protein